MRTDHKISGREHVNSGWRFNVFYGFVWVSFIVPIIFISIRMITGNFDDTGSVIHSRSDYLLMLVECILGCISINAPAILAKKLKFEIPMFLYVMFILFLYCAIFLGEVRSFYYRFRWWDSMLHTMSSMMTGFWGMMIITICNHDEHVIMRLSPTFVGIFAFCFSVTIGALWEIYEFSGDSILGLNMQKFMTVDGTNLVGHAALADTMKDIIIDVIGALISSVTGVFGVKHKSQLIIPRLTEKTGDETGKANIRDE